MKTHAWKCLPLIAVTFCLAVPGARAERADRDKPVNLEANRITIDDAKKTQVLEGNVQLTQGTLMIRAEKIIVVQDANGFNKGTAFAANNKLATFRQKREGKDEYIEGEAERIEYDGRADKVELFNRAYIKSGQDEVRGRYIAYDGKTENYVAASSSPAGDKGSGSERVHAVIQPKNKDGGRPAGQ